MSNLLELINSLISSLDEINLSFCSIKLSLLELDSNKEIMNLP